MCLLADLNNAVKYIKLVIENESIRMGENSRVVGVKLLEMLKELIGYINTSNLEIMWVTVSVYIEI